LRHDYEREEEQVDGRHNLSKLHIGEAKRLLLERWKALFRVVAKE
jgi:alpha-ketoglutarate-dependent taurine dioxygenase